MNQTFSKFFNFKEFKEAYDYIDNNRETTMKIIMKLDSED